MGRVIAWVYRSGYDTYSVRFLQVWLQVEEDE